MKKNILLASILLLNIIGLSAQPILRGEIFGSAKGKTIDLIYSNLSSTNVITMPTGGANQVYDYLKLTYLSPSSYPLYTTSIPQYPDITHADVDYYDYISNTQILAAYDQLIKIDTSEITYLGWHVQALENSLGAITGNTKDSLVIKEQISRFTVPITIQKFPMTIEKLISNGTTTYLDYNGTVSIASFGLSKAPFVRRRFITQRDSVIGWGILKRTNPQSVIVTDSILLSQRSVFVKDSFYLNGSAAPSTLLAALGATQGRVDSFGRINSWRAGRPYSIFNIVFDLKTKAYLSGITEWGTPLSTGIYSPLPEANWSVSPNPVLSDNNMLLKYNASEAVQLTIYDLKGNIIQNLKLPENPSGEPTNMTLKNDLNNGMYILKMNSTKEQKTIKIVVNK